MSIVMTVALIGGCAPGVSKPVPTAKPTPTARVEASTVVHATPTASPATTKVRPDTDRPTQVGVGGGPRSSEGSAAELAVVMEIFGPTDGPAAARVADCESGGDATPGAEPITINAGAINGVHAGPFQLSRTYQESRARKLGFTWAQMFEMKPNTIVAHDLFEEKGKSFEPPNGWTCAWAAA